MKSNRFEIYDNVFVCNPKTGWKDRGSIATVFSCHGDPVFYEVILYNGYRCFCTSEVLEVCE